jgi:hypothetical protein
MELTRQQELALISIGLNTLLRGLEIPTKKVIKKVTKPKRRMSKEARQKIARMMKKRWRQARANGKNTLE